MTLRWLLGQHMQPGMRVILPLLSRHSFPSSSCPAMITIPSTPTVITTSPASQCAPHAPAESLRTILQDCCSGGHAHVVVSYCRKVLNQSGCGHFSPIGAYHAGQDMALILDVVRALTNSCMHQKRKERRIVLHSIAQQHTCLHKAGHHRQG